MIDFDGKDILSSIFLRGCTTRRPILPQGRQDPQGYDPAHIEILKSLIAAAGIKKVDRGKIVIRKHQNTAVP